MKLKVTDLKKQLKTYDQKELIQLIADLHKMNKEVQTYLAVQFLGKEAVDEFFEQQAKKISDEFFPERGAAKLRLGQAKQAITDFKKITGDELKTVDLMLYYVEAGVEFTSSYGDIDAQFYNSMEDMYAKVIDQCYQKDEYYEEFAHRLEMAVTESETVGWGFHDELSSLFYELKYTKEDEEE